MQVEKTQLVITETVSKLQPGDTSHISGEGSLGTNYIEKPDLISKV